MLERSAGVKESDCGTLSLNEVIRNLSDDDED